MSLPTLNDDNNKKKSQQGGKMNLPNLDMPSLNENEFKELPVEEALYEKDDNEVNEDIYDEAERLEEAERESELPQVEDPNEVEEIQTEDDYYPDYEEEEEKSKEDKFIDKKKKKLIPFGGKKSNRRKRLVKSSDFDDRKNKLAKTKIIQFSILSVIAILFLLGLKNTFMPSHVYTADQIREFAAQGAGQTGFPEERGKAYVESFMEVYLELDRAKPENIQMLSYFYGEKEFANSNSHILNMRWNSETKQEVIIPPRVFEVDLLNEYSAQYKVSAYVSNTDGKTVSGNEPIGRWLSFSVNVYYDEESDSMIITPDSPSIIPAYRITNQSVVPERVPLGTSINNEILPALSPTINGFIEAFAKSSMESHDSVLQYIDDSDNVALYDGFGGSVELNGDPEGAIKKVIYNTESGVYLADLTVEWIDVAASQGDHQVEYTSRYIMEIKPITDGKYAVSSFVPYTYYK